jgi:hypothetical protein
MRLPIIITMRFIRVWGEGGLYWSRGLFIRVVFYFPSHDMKIRHNLPKLFCSGSTPI